MKKSRIFFALLPLLIILTACGEDPAATSYTPNPTQGLGAFFNATSTPSTNYLTPTPEFSTTRATRTAGPTVTAAPVSSKPPSSPITTRQSIGPSRPAATLTANETSLLNKTWQNISPPEVSTKFDSPPNNYGFQAIALEPQNGTIYVGTCNQGLWKSSDQGKTWRKVNTGSNAASLDSGRLWSLVIDPVNPQVMYTTAGYGTGGILKSINGGVDWTDMIPVGSPARTAVNSADIYSIALDPKNHNHILAAFHSVQGAGKFLGNAPVIESLDGGYNWNIHALPKLGYTHYIFFLDNSSTWLLGTQQNGFWRTSDSGQTWTKVSNINITDGGSSLYRSKTGVWYAASEGGVLSSADGVTWKQLATPVPVYSVIGDGTYLYTQQAFAGTNPFGQAPFYFASEESGATWKPMNSQKFIDGPMGMIYDPINHFIYSSNWSAGVWKLQTASET